MRDTVTSNDPHVRRRGQGWRQRPRAVLVAVMASVVAWSVPSAPASAQDEAAPAPALPGAERLPAEAAAFATVRPLDAADAFAFADLLGGLYPEVGATVADVRRALGLQAWSRSELSGLGFDAAAPVLVAWGRPVGPPGPTVLSHRVVVHVADSAKAEAYIAGVLGRLGLVVARPGGKGVPAFWAALAPLAKGADIAVAGAPGPGRPPGPLVVCRRAPGLLLIDVLEPVAVTVAARAAAGRSLPRLYAGLLAAERPARGSKATPPATLATTLGSGSRRRLVDEEASLAVTFDPEKLAALAHSEACRRLARGGDRGAPPGAWLDDVTVALRLRPFEWRARVSAGLSAAGRAGLAASGADDGLVDVRAMASAGLGAGALFLPAFRALHANARPPAFAGVSWAGLAAAVDRCDGPARLALWTRWAPQLADLYVEDIARKLGAAGALGQARNVGLAWQPGTPDPTKDAVRSTWLLSLAGEARDELTTALGRVAEGTPERAGYGDRSPTLFTLSGGGGGLKAAGLEALPGGRVGLAATDAPGALDWYYTSKRRPAVFGNRARLGSVFFNVGRRLELDAESADPSTLAAVHLAAQQIGMLGGDLVLTADGLAELSLELGNAP